MRKLLILLALMVSGCSATTISSPINLGIPTIDRGIILEDTTEQNWILVLVMMNPARDIITIAVDTYTTLDNSPNTSHSEIPALLTPQPEPVEFIGPLELEDRGIILIEEVTDEII